jgi:hypothetical protein
MLCRLVTAQIGSCPWFVMSYVPCSVIPGGSRETNDGS